MAVVTIRGNVRVEKGQGPRTTGADRLDAAVCFVLIVGGHGRAGARGQGPWFRFQLKIMSGMLLAGQAR